MAVKKRGLGRGLDALLKSVNTVGVEPESEAATADFAEDGVLRRLPIEQVQKGRYQPRRTINQDSLKELSDSIRAQGVVQPIVVRPMGDGCYEIIAGERRWRAAQLAGLSEVPAVVRAVSEQVALAIALIENIQREDLNPLEEALAIKRLIDEFQMTHQQVAEAIGRSRAGVSNLLRLLELGEEARRFLEEGQLEMGHARALLPLSVDLQREAAQQVMLRGLSVRETEDLARKLQEQPRQSGSSPPIDPDLRVLQNDLADRLGARVRVQHSSSGKGKLVIHYNTLDELDGIIAHLK